MTSFPNCSESVLRIEFDSDDVATVASASEATTAGSGCTGIATAAANAITGGRATIAAIECASKGNDKAWKVIVESKRKTRRVVKLYKYIQCGGIRRCWRWGEGRRGAARAGIK